MAIAVLDDRIEGRRAASWRWSACFATVLALHVAGLWLALNFWHARAPMLAGPPPLAMIELAPLPSAPAVATPAPPPEPVPSPPSEESAPPTPAPVVPVSLPAKPKPQRHVPPRHEPPAMAATPAPPVAAPPTSAPPAPVVAAPQPSNAVPNWQSALLARLERYKRYPRLAQSRHQQGVAQLRFTMDRQGHVLSAQIVKSAGYEALDDETLALVRRAEPLPPPPAEVPGEMLSLTVPVQFFLK